MDLYPEQRFWSFPTIWEASAIVCVVAALSWTARATAAAVLAGLWIQCEVALDASEKVQGGELLHLAPVQRIASSILSCGYKNAVELGHLACPIGRGSFRRICHRWDWWCGSEPPDVGEKRRDEAARLGCMLLSAGFSYKCEALSLALSATLFLACAATFAIGTSGGTLPPPRFAAADTHGAARD